MLTSVFSTLAVTASADEVATAEEAITKVWAATKFLQDKGVSGVASMNSKDGP
jgi:hypothetical protein